MIFSLIHFFSNIQIYLVGVTGVIGEVGEVGEVGEMTSFKK